MKYFMSKKCAVLCCTAVLLGVLSACSTDIPNSDNTYVSVKIKVLDSVCGSPITEDSALTVFEARKHSIKYDTIPVVNGVAEISLKKNRAYDFHLKGKN